MSFIASVGYVFAAQCAQWDENFAKNFIEMHEFVALAKTQGNTENKTSSKENSSELVNGVSCCPIDDDWSLVNDFLDSEIISEELEHEAEHHDYQVIKSHEGLSEYVSNTIVEPHINKKVSTDVGVVLVGAGLLSFVIGPAITTCCLSSVGISAAGKFESIPMTCYNVMYR